MHKLLLLGGVGVLLGLPVFAYEPTSQDQESLTSLKSQLSTLISDDNPTLRSFYQQVRDFAQQPLPTESIRYQIEHLRDHLLTQLESKMAAQKLSSRTNKQNLVAAYENAGLQTADPLHENCLGRYTTLDQLSFAYDLPTALTIAVWWRESSCGYYLPKNGDGPFQIVSKDYGS